ncbi:rho GTPase-activating protein 29 isoform X1 [Tachysurus ichikawai]
MFASGMFQQSSLGNKRSGAGITRVSSSHFFPPGPGSGSRAGSVRSDSLSSISSDPEYIMQLVSDVRKFADVLLHLKEAFNSKGKGKFREKRRLIGLQEEKLYSPLYWVVDYSPRASFISGQELGFGSSESDQVTITTWIIILSFRILRQSLSCHRVGRRRGDAVSVPLKFCETGGGTEKEPVSRLLVYFLSADFQYFHRNYVLNKQTFIIFSGLRDCSTCRFSSFSSLTINRWRDYPAAALYPFNTAGSQLIAAIEVGKALVSSSQTACFSSPPSVPSPSSIARIAGIPVEQTLTCCFRPPHQQDSVNM